MADKILIIRHAEKPDRHAKGVTYDGKCDENSLVVRGWQRAGALSTIIPYILRDVPSKIYACCNSEHSQRAFNTVLPLAWAIGIDIDTSIDRDDTDKMARKAKKQEGIVLICWEHERIYDIGKHLSKHTPSVWPDDRYDIIYLYDKLKGCWYFEQIPQIALIGDSIEFIPNRRKK